MEAERLEALNGLAAFVEMLLASGRLDDMDLSDEERSTFERILIRAEILVVGGE